ncbi:MAG: hypothetical protein J5527_10900 [Treponema sp.]|nr:hypothetical protein [Treponema sp.]
MKKIWLFALLILFSVSSFAAGKRIAVFNPAGEGLSADEMNWIPSSVRRRLESNFNDYTPYTLVDVQNEDSIKKLQKKAEGYSYDQQTSIELGKLVSAELGVFTTITKVNDRYILSSSITNLTTGVRLSSVTTDSVPEAVTLFEGAGSSVNRVTVKFCEDLGIKLSSIDLYVLLKGSDISDTDQISLTQEEVSRYEKKQKELEKQIKEVSVSAEIDAETRKAKLEAEKALAEQQKKIAEERLERLRLQQQRLYEDQQQQKTRTAAQRQKIEQAAAKAEQQAKLVRQKKIDNLTLDNQIAIIEAKKQAMLDIHNSVLNQEKLIKQNANDDYKAQCQAIDNEPLRKGETDAEGNILPAVKQLRNERKQAIKNELEAKALEDLKSIQGKTSEQETALYNDIQRDIQKLKAKRTISSIEDNRILDIGNYAGDRYEWDTTVSIFINDVKIFGQKANISYQSVSGKAPILPTGSNLNSWNDYLDTVDLYDYMFRRNVPAITLEIDYSIEPMSEYYPSMYRMTLYEFRFIDTVSGNTVQTIQPAKSSYRFSVNPAVDISYYKPAATAEVKEDKPKNFVHNEDVKTGKAAKKRKKKSVNPLYDQSNNGGARMNIGCNFGWALSPELYQKEDEGINLEAYMSLPITTWMFMQCDFSFLTIPRYFDKYYSGSGVLKTVTYDTGFNVRLGSAGMPPNLYILGGIGLGFDEDFVTAHTTQTESVLVYKAEAGIDVQVTDFLCITLGGGLFGVKGLGPAGMVKVGAALTLPDLLPFF